MNKALFVLLVLMIGILALVGVFVFKPQTEPATTVQKNPSPVQTEQPLIGGQKDEHGCLPAAGYSWCESKNKCLKAWEEACSASEKTPSRATGIKYQNDTYGFELTFPDSWSGYTATEHDYPDYTSISFSFGGNRQPFSIFSLIHRTPEQAISFGENMPEKVLVDDVEGKLVCDGCCFEGGDTSGGGQFDDFQKLRCAEVPQILKLSLKPSRISKQ